MLFAHILPRKDLEINSKAKTNLELIQRLSLGLVCTKYISWKLFLRGYKRHM